MSVERWATRQEVADHLAVSLDKVDQLVRDGMPSVELSPDGSSRKHRRFRLSLVDEWVEQNGAKA